MSKYNFYEIISNDEWRLVGIKPIDKENQQDITLATKTISLEEKNPQILNINGELPFSKVTKDNILIGFNNHVA